MNRILFVLVFIITFAYSLDAYHHCEHDLLLIESEPVRQSNHYYGRASLSYQPIRIHFNFDSLTFDDRACSASGDSVDIGFPENSTVTCNSTAGVISDCVYVCTENDILTEPKNLFLQNDIISNAKAWLANTIEVIPVGGSLLLQTNITCGTSGGVLISDSMDSFPDTDLVIFVTARPTVTRVLAYASYCEHDEYTGRPVAGHINFDPKSISTTNLLSSQLRIAIHEITHILGFSASKFNDFRDPNDDYSLLSNVLIHESIDLGMAPRNVTKIATPEVIRIAREHYNCSSIDGVEIEDGGGLGTIGSHWEKRILNDEFMTGTASNNPKISKFTLALLQDSGWYQVFYDTVDTFMWGMNQGCDFTEASCAHWTEKNGGCKTKSKPGCSFDYTAKAECTLRTGISNIPEQYQYFSDPTKGGYLSLPDYCPFYNPYSNGDCRNVANVGTDKTESFCENCRCYESSAYLSANGESTETLPSCYKTACTNSTNLRVKVGHYWYICTKDLQKVKLIGDVGGELTCPYISRMCTGSSYDNDWPVFSTVTPSSGFTGDVLQIKGIFDTKANYSVIIGGVECSSATVHNNVTLIVIIGDMAKKEDGTAWVVLQDRNSQKSYVKYDAFEIKNPGLSKKTTIIIAVVVGVIGFLLICGIVVCCYCCCCSSKKKVGAV